MDPSFNYYYPAHSGPPPQPLPPQQAQMMPVMQNAGAQQGPPPPHPQNLPPQQAQMMPVMQNATGQQGPPPSIPSQQQVVHGGQRQQQQMMGGAGPPPPQQQQLGPQQSQHAPPPPSQLQHPNHQPPTHHHQQQHHQQQSQHLQHPQQQQVQQPHQQQQHHPHHHPHQQQLIQQHQGLPQHQQHQHHRHHHQPQHHPHQQQQPQGPHPHQMGGPPMNVVGGPPPPHHPQQGIPPPQQPIPPHNMAGPPPPPPPTGISQTEFRILEMNRRLQSRVIINRQSITPLPTPPQYEESLWWERFANDFFEDDATITLTVHLDDKPTRYTIGRTLIPRFFRSYFEGGVIDLQINLRHPKETFNTSHITLDCDQATIVSHIQIGPQQTVVVCTSGHLSLDFVNGMIRSWNFTTRGCREYIERSSSMGQSQDAILRNITRQGLTNSTLLYLKMCVILEPMQDLMYEHKLSNMKPQACLKHILHDKWKVNIDIRTQTNKRRKRKPSTATGGAVGNKKTTKNNANSINNSVTTPSDPPSFSLASQDVMVVGEPSLMGGDFGDDNERLITRMENTQYDPSASTPNNMNDGSLSPSMNNNTPDRGNGGPGSVQSPCPPTQPQEARL